MRTIYIPTKTQYMACLASREIEEILILEIVHCLSMYHRLLCMYAHDHLRHQHDAQSEL